MQEKKQVLFVCIENSCRSQMAEALIKYYYPDQIEAYSAGSKPSGSVDKDAIAAMREIGVDITQNKSKGFADLPVKEFDYVVTLGCQDACPFFPADRHIAWDIPDPKGRGIDFFRLTRDLIKCKISNLADGIFGGPSITQKG